MTIITIILMNMIMMAMCIVTIIVTATHTILNMVMITLGDMSLDYYKLNGPSTLIHNRL